MKLDEFKEEVNKLGISYNEEMIEKLKIYCEYLLEYNKHTNLTAIRDEEGVFLKHFYDALTIVKAISLNDVKTVADVGTGAGFPGVVLKIFYPHLNVVLLDSNNKKTKFLESLVEKLGLINIEIINDRVENLAKKQLNYFDLVTARAVANMRVLSELVIPLVRKDGFFVAMKGKMDEELDEALGTIEAMGGKIVDKKCFNLYQGDGERTLIKILKIRDTFEKELRPYEKIIKKPLQK